MTDQPWIVSHTVYYEYYQEIYLHNFGKTRQKMSIRPKKIRQPPICLLILYDKFINTIFSQILIDWKGWGCYTKTKVLLNGNWSNSN